MSQPLHQLDVVSVGNFVPTYLKENKLILFSDPVPDDIGEYCAVHRSKEFNAVLAPGQVLKINNYRYHITAVGSVATANLKQLGHITLNFDGASIAELPGTVHLCGRVPENINPGDHISIYRKE